MSQNHILMDKYKSLVSDRTLTIEEYHKGQKTLLREGIDALKQQPHANLDYIIGSNARYDGDKYGIEIKNALNHLMRAYKNGNECPI